MIVIYVMFLLVAWFRIKLTPFICRLHVFIGGSVRFSSQIQKLTEQIMCWRVLGQVGSMIEVPSKYEPPRGKTNNVVSEQVGHKPTCTVTEKS